MHAMIFKKGKITVEFNVLYGAWLTEEHINERILANLKEKEIPIDDAEGVSMIIKNPQIEWEK